MNDDLTIAILAGGESRRMGRDKASLGWRGRTLLEHVAAVCAGAGLPVLVVGRALPPDWSVPDVAFAPDARPGLGPLGGLVTALGAAPGAVLLVSCDLPFLTPDAVRWLANEAAASCQDDDGVVAVTDRPQFLFAVYRQQVLDLARRRLLGDDRSLRGLVAAGSFALAPALDAVVSALRSANTPGEWRALTEETP